MREADIKTQICKAIKQAGGLAVVIWQGPMSQRGIADVLACYRGRFYAIEVKKPGGRVTKQQERFLERVEQAGGVGLVATSAAEVIRRLELSFPLFEDPDIMTIVDGNDRGGWIRHGVMKR
jgi:Holliday junction resolvase